MTHNPKDQGATCVTVQEDIIEQHTKLSEFLTHYQQIESGLMPFSDCHILDNVDNEDSFDHLFFQKDEENSDQSDDIPMEYDPIFKVEKI
mmetsp:Transcript_31041/g.30593  ORF Transcript_31041/g.30593 Transcript_31041/m.30593 type:complete len:90 (+) Transcript_31041:160-429(+)|eukprot:CAMPEP_0196999838 /NCGR_PEP_ID=MMETSP1380-20130617/4933_1 /TAXON_ID=5936 /ORGANISM="Euplotes crassus, Strain CT5" /LENGTH=89 /DNA_ID=CAMNT_0042416905 /DNA_START=160 /DNA_END=429 /DNA_ORIENTATION=-